jgi:hypothetical protein
MSDVRLCKDCRWVTWPWRHMRDSDAAMCIHPSAVSPSDVTPDRVTGRKDKRPPGSFCDTERRFGGCGPEGKNWEEAGAKPAGFV